GIQPYADVCAVYGVPPEDQDSLQNDPAFKRRLLTAEAAVEDSEALQAMRSLLGAVLLCV
ncbi:MAG: hypothetical protein KA204_00290, partial [Chromatiaceae bacterium]|nr:hypothetical protein [Chromatiaceae bacterium]MBP6733851.1 hypothetical protein [Chromatiaceae bacterium]MBP6807070.1 hypothetical protein [Chromatiaceae bacterium]